jgi:hypothetical protein
MSTAQKLIGQTAYRFAPIVVTQKTRLELQHPAVRLWRELFESVPLKRFSSKLKFRISRACNSPHDNPNAKMYELFIEMKKAGMGFADCQAIVADLDCYSRLLYQAPVTEACIQEASMQEALHDAETDIAQLQLATEVNKENAEAFRDRALRAVGSLQNLIVLTGRYAEKR